MPLILRIPPTLHADVTRFGAKGQTRQSFQTEVRALLALATEPAPRSAEAVNACRRLLSADKEPKVVEALFNEALNKLSHWTAKNGQPGEPAFVNLLVGLSQIDHPHLQTILRNLFDWSQPDFRRLLINRLSLAMKEYNPHHFRRLKQALSSNPVPSREIWRAEHWRHIFTRLQARRPLEQYAPEHFSRLAMLQELTRMELPAAKMLSALLGVDGQPKTVSRLEKALVADFYDAVLGAGQGTRALLDELRAVAGEKPPQTPSAAV
jgi:hypothetical protein